jgi:hypothetical protein
MRTSATTLFCAAALLFVGCENGVTSISHHGPQDIDCSESYVAVKAPGSFKCTKLQAVASDDAGRGMFQRFNLSGKTSDGTTVNIQGHVALTNNTYIYGVSSDPLKTIQGFNDWTQAAHNWTSVRTLGSSYVVKFTTERNLDCVGFVSPGQQNSRGWQSYSRGYICPASGKAAFTDDQVRELLSKIQVLDKPTGSKPVEPVNATTKQLEPGETSPAIAAFAAKMKALKDAYEQGSISFDEYESKRKALINAL